MGQVHPDQESGGSPSDFIQRKRQQQGKGKRIGASLTSLNLQAKAFGETATGSTAATTGYAQQDQAYIQLLHDWIRRELTSNWQEFLEASFQEGTAENAAYMLGSLPAQLWQSASPQLNPARPRWMMGLPPIWCQAAISAHRKTIRAKHGS